jgi:hypothetical protein
MTFSPPPPCHSESRLVGTKNLRDSSVAKCELHVLEVLASLRVLHPVKDVATSEIAMIRKKEH